MLLLFYDTVTDLFLFAYVQIFFLNFIFLAGNKKEAKKERMKNDRAVIVMSCHMNPVVYLASVKHTLSRMPGRGQKAEPFPHHSHAHTFYDTWAAVFVCLNPVLYPLQCRGVFIVGRAGHSGLDVWGYTDVCSLFLLFFSFQALLGQQIQILYKKCWAPTERLGVC